MGQGLTRLSQDLSIVKQNKLAKSSLTGSNDELTCLVVQVNFVSETNIRMVLVRNVTHEDNFLKKCLWATATAEMPVEAGLSRLI
jgi:hypothetical protein